MGSQADPGLSPSLILMDMPPPFTNTAQEWPNGCTPGPEGLGAPTHLLHTMAMTTTAMRKTRAAAEEPTMSGSFSWMLVWYSAGEKAQRSVLSLALGALTAQCPVGSPRIPDSVPAPHRVPVTCSGGELVTLDMSMNCSDSQILTNNMGIIIPPSQC